VACVWAQYGPYHISRVRELQRLAGRERVSAVEIASRTNDYLWQRSGAKLKLHTLCDNVAAEQVSFCRVLLRARRKLKQLRVRVCFVPSYFPKQSVAILMAARALKLKTVMMNETHRGTARATGCAALGKRWLISLFDAALVGGKPQRRYFTSMGIPDHRIFDGYDAVDNDYFKTKAFEIRRQSAALRDRFRLPDRYFLSLGRLVEKKNLETLILAYRRYLETSPAKRTHLVIVGAGEQGTRLRWLCYQLGLAVYEKSDVAAPQSDPSVPKPATGVGQLSISSSEPFTKDRVGVHFYGFRQIEQNPVFYALADAFVLPSVREEWGLVVNEAMASALPVVVSETAGCAEDLLEPGFFREQMSDGAAELLLATNLQSRMRQNGLVFAPGSSEELGRILVLLESCEELRQAMGQSSSRIVEKFSCENFAKNALLAARAATGVIDPDSHPPTTKESAFSF
jgi:glycosyltransferase involved in cell wall biosynthesis